MNALAVADIGLHEVEGAPRVLDLDVANRLGFKRPRVIRELIKRNMAELEQFGAVWRGAKAVTSGRGRKSEVEEFYLNEEQALLVAVLSDAEHAADVRAMLIRVFVAWRRGQLVEPEAPKITSAMSREARLFFKQAIGIAKIAGLKGNQMLIAANRGTRAAVGFDHLAEMGIPYMPAADNDVLLTATDIGKRVGGLSAVRVNALLAEAGYQTGDRDQQGRTFWLPTEKGIAAGGTMVEVERSNHTGQARQLRWATRIVPIVQSLIEA